MLIHAVNQLKSVIDSDRCHVADGGSRRQLLVPELPNNGHDLVRVQRSLDLSPLVPLLRDQRLDFDVILAHLFELLTDLEFDFRVLEGSLRLDMPLVPVLVHLNFRLRGLGQLYHINQYEHSVVHGTNLKENEKEENSPFA